MMQKIEILFKRSRIFQYLMGFMIFGSAIISASLSISCIYKILLIFSVLTYGAWILWEDVYLMSASSIVGFELLEKGLCQLRYSSGDTVQAAVDGGSTVTTVVCVLRFQISGQRKKASCVVFKDALDSEMYRQLMVWLRCFDGDN